MEIIQTIGLIAGIVVILTPLAVLCITLNGKQIHTRVNLSLHTLITCVLLFTSLLLAAILSIWPQLYHWIRDIALINGALWTLWISSVVMIISRIGWR